jgi:hypothetical protein
MRAAIVADERPVQPCFARIRRAAALQLLVARLQSFHAGGRRLWNVAIGGRVAQPFEQDGGMLRAQRREAQACRLQRGGFKIFDAQWNAPREGFMLFEID